MRRPSSFRTGHVPALECRQLLSGNVHATFAHGTLTINGDNSANQLLIQPSEGGGVRVIATNGTRLNGVVNGERTFAAPTQTNIHLLGGDDHLEFWGSSFTGGLSVWMGGGDDSVVMNVLQITGDVMLDFGSGNDSFRTNFYPPVPSSSPSLANSTSVVRDAVFLDVSLVMGNLTLLGGSGNDKFDISAFSVTGNLKIDSGSGDDWVNLTRGRTEGTTSIQLGNGNDTMFFADRNSTGRVHLDAGSGDDNVRIFGDFPGRQVFRQSVEVILGDGNDTLIDYFNTYESTVTQNGGRGTDSHGSVGILPLGSSILGFEIPLALGID